jgi:hypothetical protein
MQSVLLLAIGKVVSNKKTQADQLCEASGKGFRFSVHTKNFAKIMLNGLKNRLRQGINIKIYANSTLDDVIEWVGTKSGLSAVTLIYCLFLATVTASLLVVQMQKTEHLNGNWAMPSGTGIAILLELFAFICAVRGLLIGSVVGVSISVLVLRGTFGSQYFDDSSINFFMPITWDYPYFLSWVLSGAFPFMIGYLAHEIRRQIELEEIAKDKLKQDNPQEYQRLFGNF